MCCLFVSWYAVNTRRLYFIAMDEETATKFRSDAVG